MGEADTGGNARGAQEKPAVDLREVAYFIGAERILDNVSWRISEGERWAVLGPNGSGKTTLLKMLCGYLWPNAGGEVLRNGQALLDLRELRQSIGWVSSYLCGQIPPREIVLHTAVSGAFAQIGLWEQNIAEAQGEVLDRAAQYLEELGCGGLAGRQFGSLSQGEQQKVLIARARMARPFLIILDEPCAGLDPGARETFLKSIQELADRSSVGLVIVTHHIEEIMPAFDRIIVLKDGKLLHSGLTREVLREELLEQLYGVPLRIVSQGGRYWPVCV